MWSILLYAISALAAGFATSLPMLLFLRTTTFVGVCVEFVAAVAWLAELFPDPKRREAVLGYIQAFSSIGGLLVRRAYFPRGSLCRRATRDPWSPCALAIHAHLRGYPSSSADHHPSLPARIARMGREKAEGTLKRPSIAELFAPQLGRQLWLLP